MNLVIKTSLVQTVQALCREFVDQSNKR